MLPSGCPMAFPEWILARVHPDSESSGNPVVALGEMLVCPHWQPDLVGTVTALASNLASRLLF